MSHLRCVIVAVHPINGHWLVKCSLVQTGSMCERKKKHVSEKKQNNKKVCFCWAQTLSCLPKQPFVLPCSRIMWLTFCFRLCHFFYWGWRRWSPCSLLFLSPPLDLLLLKLKNRNLVVISDGFFAYISDLHPIITRPHQNKPNISTYCSEFLQQHKAIFPSCSKFLKGLMALN